MISRSASSAIALLTSRARTFTIVGNVDPSALQPLVERYIGSLPSKNSKPGSWKDPRITYAAGKVNKELKAGTEPRSMVSMWFSAPDTWSEPSDADAKVLGMVLRIRLREVLREDMGGVYGVRSYVGISREPTQRRVLSISFGCDPQNVDKLRKAALDVMHELANEGANASNLEKVTEQLKRGREDGQQGELVVVKTSSATPTGSARISAR